MPPPVSVHIHSGLFPDQEVTEAHAALAQGRVLPRLLYQGDAQAALWLRLFQHWSPYAGEGGTTHMFRQAFAELTGQSGRAVDLVALGCGGAQKECEWIAQLTAAGRPVRFVGVDVSVPLLTGAVLRARNQLPPDQIHALAASLTASDGVKEWLAEQLPGTTDRVVTLFSVIPNFTPRELVDVLRSWIRPGDQLLYSVNLAPDDRVAVETSILPQYDNEETREWLLSFVELSGGVRADGELRFGLRRIAEPPAHWRIEARWHFVRRATLHVRGRRFDFVAGESIELFFSCRHTLRALGEFMAPFGFEAVKTWPAEDGAEAVVSSRRTA